MARRSLLIFATVSAIIWSGTALAVYQETSITVTDKGTPVPGQTVILTKKQKDPQHPQNKPIIKNIARGKTSSDGKAAFKTDDKDSRPDIVYDITLRGPGGKSRTMRNVESSVVLAGGTFDFTNVPFSSDTGAANYGSQTAQVVVQPVSYVPSWTFVIGGNIGAGQSTNKYDDFTFDGDGWGGGGFAIARFYTQSGFFIGPELGAMALHVNGTNPDGAFAKIRWAAFEGGQIGYSFRTPGTTPLNVYIGAAASQAEYTVGIDTRVFFESMNKTLSGWSAHAGFEVQPAPLSIPNLWIGVDYRHSYWSGDIGGDKVSGRLDFISATASYQFSAGR